MAVFKKTKGTPRTQQEYVESLDPLLRKNTGSFINQGYDTSSNTPYFLPNARQVAQPQGLTGGLNLSIPQTDYQIQYQQPQMPQMPQAKSQNDRYKVNSVSFLESLTAPREPEPLQTLRDGGVYYSNGAIKYQDGTERFGDPSAYGIASLMDGGVQYSDGSVRRTTPTLVMDLGSGKGYYSDGTVRHVSQQEIKGVSGLQQGMFGEQFPITQAYGNRNAELYPNSGIHRGLDIGSGNAQLTSPFTGRVVQRFYDDGTRWGSKSGHQGYGNSVLIQLDTGELLRFSHLSDSALREGDIVETGTLIGTTGSTGNSTGAHLDLEYYDANGRLSDPNNFSAMQMGGIETGTIVDENELSPEQRQQVESVKPYFNNSSRMDRPYNRPQGQVLGDQAQQNQQPNYPQIKVGGDASNFIADRGRQYNLPEMGVSEAVNNLGQTASKAVYDTTQGTEQLGKAVGAPELLFGEIGQGEQGVGFQELMKGDIAGAGKELGDYVNRVGTINKAPDFNIGEGIQKASELAQGASKNIKNAYNGAVLGASNVARGSNPLSPTPAYASSEFNPSEPISTKVNKGLVEDKILSTLDGLKSKFNLSNIKPQEVAQNAFDTGQSLMTSAVDAGQQGIQSVADQASRAKNIIVDTFDGESEDDSDNNPVENAVSAVTSVFKKPSTSSSSSSKSSSSSNKSSSSSNKSSSSSSSSNSSPIVLKQTSASSKSDAAIKAISQGKLLMSSATNPKAVNYQPKSTPKPAPKPAPTPVFKKVADTVKSFISNIFKR